MDEIYRMLGRDHEADLAREAGNRHIADEIRRGRDPKKPVRAPRRPVAPRLLAFVRLAISR